MKTVTYIGPHQAVVIPLPNGAAYECEREGNLELPDTLADELIARGDWKAAKTKKTTKPKKGTEE